MTGPGKTKRIASHVVALGAGVIIAAISNGLTKPDENRWNAAEAQPPPESSSAAASRKSARDAAASATSRSAAFRMAWNQMKRTPMAWTLRSSCEAKLLSEWVEVDPIAAMKTTVDERDGWTMSGAFRTFFAEHPLDAWKAFSSGRLGPNISGLELAWAETTAKKDPKLVASLLGEMPRGFQRSAMGQILNADYSTGRQSILDAIHNLSDPDKSAALLISAYKMMDAVEPTEVLRTQWSTLPDGSPQRKATMAGWATTLRGMDAAGITGEFANLPESERGGAAKALLASIGQDVPALLPALDQAIAAGQWDYIAQSSAGKASGTRRPKELAEWAMNLPERPEATNLFHEMTSAYVSRDPDGARAMLEALPESDWRWENGMVDIYRNELWRDNDLEKFNSRLATLTSPAAIRAAEKARYSMQISLGKKITH